ncbi:hypothetical protein SporoP37_02095 [Sporosarcina sp. P37]|uniref:hypothetical protein n=1 Tax=unclassified Sporosarcina TaxID=2647733 RepID=UPI000A17B7F8|nr:MULTISPECIES: hypothetical protein [unclassified Sporosarcina]ARK23599.1 hypothetical protein SporoP37_02095 [Sporosarcina sp. P37]PID18777.1 hypothetical protein CSV62_06655 [Sporosarcina sp. P35]
MFTVTIKAGSPAEREQRVHDLLVKGYTVVKYIDDEKHGKFYTDTKNKYTGGSYGYAGSGGRKIYAAIMRPGVAP